MIVISLEMSDEPNKPAFLDIKKEKTKAEQKKSGKHAEHISLTIFFL